MSGKVQSLSLLLCTVAFVGPYFVEDGRNRVNHKKVPWESVGTLVGQAISVDAIVGRALFATCSSFTWACHLMTLRAMSRVSRGHVVKGLSPLAESLWTTQQ